MFPFTDKVAVNKLCKTIGTNKTKYIILHHTGTKNYKGELNVLSGKNYNPKNPVSCHFLVGPDGQTAKIGEPTDILHHVGVSERGREPRLGQSLNHMCLGIEITGPLEDGGFIEAQKKTVKVLVEHLMAVFGIDQEHVLRHCDLTHNGSKNKVYRKVGTVGRKRDVAHTFFPKSDFLAWRKTLVPLAQ